MAFEGINVRRPLDDNVVLNLAKISPVMGVNVLGEILTPYCLTRTDLIVLSNPSKKNKRFKAVSFELRSSYL